MAWVSIGKFALFVFGSAFLIWRYFIAPIQKQDNYLKAPHATAHAVPPCQNELLHLPLLV